MDKGIIFALILCQVRMELMYDGVSIIILDCGINSPSAISFKPCTAPDVIHILLILQSTPLRFIYFTISILNFRFPLGSS